MRRLILLLLLLVSLSSSGFGHEVRPAYLGLTEREPGIYEVEFKVPVKDGLAPRLEVEFPASVTQLEEPTGLSTAGAFLRRWTVSAPDGFRNRQIRFPQHRDYLFDVLVSIRTLDGYQFSSLVSPQSGDILVPQEPEPLQVSKTYLELGVEHIWFGVDHLLFVLGLLMLVEGNLALAKTITAFTVAHSLTLAASMLGVLALPGPPVEAVIALSILYLACELADRKRTGDSSLKSPWKVAFLFGLLHGFGFAGALSEIGLPHTQVPLALAMFNVGVEVGQLLFVLAVKSLLRPLRSLEPPEWLGWVPIYALGGLSAFWVMERVGSFWSAS